jgi:hypothetical protein
VYIIIIINFVLTLQVLTASFLLTIASCTVKVVYNHTRIALYLDLGGRSVGERVRLLALDGRRGVLTPIPS